MTSIKYIFLSCIVCCSIYVSSQTEVPLSSIRHNKYLDVALKHGLVKTTSTSLFNEVHDLEDLGLFRSLSIKYTIQTVGKKEWEEIYNYPSYGFGLNVHDFYTPKSTGYPISVFGFINPSIFKYKRFNLDGMISCGMALNWKHYGYFNVDNDAVSLPRSVFIELGTETEYQLSNKIIIAVGGVVSHFSNGATRKPNQGINTIGLQYSLKYLLDKEKHTLAHFPLKPFEASNHVLVSLHYGTQNFQVDSLSLLVNDKFKGISFAAWGITGEFNRQITNYSKIGFGFNLLYDSSYGVSYFVEDMKIEEIHLIPFHKRFKFSFFPSYELVLHKFGIILQPGVYIVKTPSKLDVPLFYQRIGARYNLSKNLFCGVSLRAYNFKSANFIEYYSGYKF